MDTLAKLRALVDMKTHLLDVLGQDLETAQLRIERLRAENEVLRRQQGWCTAVRFEDGEPIPITTVELVAHYKELSDRADVKLTVVRDGEQPE